MKLQYDNAFALGPVNRGACHLKHDVFAEDMADTTGNGKAAPCKQSQDKIAMVDSIGICIFTLSAWDIHALQQQVSAACGDDWTNERLIATGERIWNLEKLFNLRAGLGKADDTLPPRLLETPCPSGVAKGRVAELDVMLPEYYQIRGWNEDGQPSSETLTRLGLDEYRAH